MKSLTTIKKGNKEDGKKESNIANLSYFPAFIRLFIPVIEASGADSLRGEGFNST